MPDRVRTFLVTTAQDAPQAAALRLPRVFLIYRVRDNALTCDNLPQLLRGGVMGVFEDGTGDAPTDVQKLAQDILQEYHKRGYHGLLLDFERVSVFAPLVTAICRQCAKRNIVCFVPVAFAAHAPGSKVIISSAISGGSYPEMIDDFAARYGPENLCLELVHARQEYILPAADADGVLLSSDAFQKIMQTYNPSVFYDSTLYSKYCTYRDADGKVHFLLFDDAPSAAKKMDYAAKQGLFAVFLLYRDWGSGVNALFSTHG